MVALREIHLQDCVVYHIVKRNGRAIIIEGSEMQDGDTYCISSKYVSELKGLLDEYI